jgi:putative nucleotidyltransferase with HDIG domain
MAEHLDTTPCQTDGAAERHEGRKPNDAIIHLTDGENSSVDLQRELGPTWKVVNVSLSDTEILNELDAPFVVFDTDLANIEVARLLRDLLPRKKKDSIWIFICDRGNRLSEVRAAALGATTILTRPVDIQQLHDYLAGLFGSPCDNHEVSDDPCAASVASGGKALASLFNALLNNKPVAAAALTEVAEDVSSGIDDAGLDKWLDVVRQYHSGTYQHCLLVTGLAATFARKLGFSRRDTSTITVAGLVHDIGKARIPIEILDKPGKLTELEFTLMKMHPLYGYDFFSKSRTLSDEIIDAVRHHHEYLDGSGYPDRLPANKIRDVTRILTISDVFGAMLEKRSYKPPMPSKDAYEVLAKMTDRGLLERPLVDAFRNVAGEIA